ELAPARAETVARATRERARASRGLLRRALAAHDARQRATASFAQRDLEQHAARAERERPLISIVRNALLAREELAPLELRDALLDQLLERNRRRVRGEERAAGRVRDRDQAVRAELRHDFLAHLVLDEAARAVGNLAAVGRRHADDVHLDVLLVRLLRDLE